MPYYDTIEVMDHIHDLIYDNKGTLGINFVGYGDEELIPKYPAVVVTGAPKERVVTGTQQFTVEFLLDLWIYHARVDQNHKTRTREDMKLADDVIGLLHRNYTLGGNIIFGFVTNEVPGILMKDRVAIVGTRLSWTGQNREPFNRWG